MNPGKVWYVTLTRSGKFQVAIVEALTTSRARTVRFPAQTQAEAEAIAYRHILSFYGVEVAVLRPGRKKGCR